MHQAPCTRNSCMLSWVYYYYYGSIHEWTGLLEADEAVRRKLCSLSPVQDKAILRFMIYFTQLARTWLLLHCTTLLYVLYAEWEGV
jgi:hypothetical protein